MKWGSLPRLGSGPGSGSLAQPGGGGYESRPRQPRRPRVRAALTSSLVAVRDSGRTQLPVTVAGGGLSCHHSDRPQRRRGARCGLDDSSREAAAADRSSAGRRLRCSDRAQRHGGRQPVAPAAAAPPAVSGARFRRPCGNDPRGRGVSRRTVTRDRGTGGQGAITGDRAEQ